MVFVGQLETLAQLLVLLLITLKVSEVNTLGSRLSTLVLAAGEYLIVQNLNLFTMWEVWRQQEMVSQVIVMVVVIKLKGVHAEKVGGISQELKGLRSSLSDIDQMKFGFDNSKLHKGKILLSANSLNFSYDTQALWAENLNFQITSGERIALKGTNGSGKTTLIKLILGSIEPQTGTIYRADSRSVYIDQDYSLIDNKLTIYEQTQQFNIFALQENFVRNM